MEEWFNNFKKEKPVPEELYTNKEVLMRFLELLPSSDTLPGCSILEEFFKELHNYHECMNSLFELALCTKNRLHSDYKRRIARYLFSNKEGNDIIILDTNIKKIVEAIWFYENFDIKKNVTLDPAETTLPNVIFDYTIPQNHTDLFLSIHRVYPALIKKLLYYTNDIDLIENIGSGYYIILEGLDDRIINSLHSRKLVNERQLMHYRPISDGIFFNILKDKTIPNPIKTQIIEHMSNIRHESIDIARAYFVFNNPVFLYAFKTDRDFHRSINKRDLTNTEMNSVYVDYVQKYYKSMYTTNTVLDKVDIGVSERTIDLKINKANCLTCKSATVKCDTCYFKNPPEKLYSDELAHISTLVSPDTFFACSTHSPPLCAECNSEVKTISFRKV